MWGVPEDIGQLVCGDESGDGGQRTSKAIVNTRR